MISNFIRITILSVCLTQSSWALNTHQHNSNVLTEEQLIVAPYFSHVLYDMAEKCGIDPDKENQIWLHAMMESSENRKLAQQAESAVHHQNKSAYYMTIKQMTCPSTLK